MAQKYTLKYAEIDGKIIIAHLSNPKFCFESHSLDEAKDKVLRAFDYYNRVQINPTTRSKPEVREITPHYSTMELYA